MIWSVLLVRPDLEAAPDLKAVRLLKLAIVVTESSFDILSHKSPLRPLISKNCKFRFGAAVETNSR